MARTTGYGNFGYSVICGETLPALLLQLFDLLADLDRRLETSDDTAHRQNGGYELCDGNVPGLGGVCATAAAIAAVWRCPGLATGQSQLFLEIHKQAGGAARFCSRGGGVAIVIRLLKKGPLVLIIFI